MLLYCRSGVVLAATYVHIEAHDAFVSVAVIGQGTCGKRTLALLGNIIFRNSDTRNLGKIRSIGDAPLQRVRFSCAHRRRMHRAMGRSVDCCQVSEDVVIRRRAATWKMIFWNTTEEN